MWQHNRFRAPESYCSNLLTVDPNPQPDGNSFSLILPLENTLLCPLTSFNRRCDRSCDLVASVALSTSAAHAQWVGTKALFCSRFLQREFAECRVLKSARAAGSPAGCGQELSETPVAAEAVHIELTAIERDDFIHAGSLSEQNQRGVGEIPRLIPVLRDQPLDRIQIGRFDLGNFDAALSHPGEEQQLGLRAQQMRDLDDHRPGRNECAVEAAEDAVGDEVKRVVSAKPGGKRSGINDCRAGHAVWP